MTKLLMLVMMKLNIRFYFCFLFCFSFSCKGLSFVNLNILCKIDELRCFVNENPISIMTLNETRLDFNIPNEEINIQGYDVLRKDRNRQGGGVGMYR